MKEAICAETPVLFMPMFAEQVRNMYFARRNGFAEYINKRNISADYVEERIRSLLDSYTARKAMVSRAKRLMLDTIIPSLDSAEHALTKLAKWGQFPNWYFRYGKKLYFPVYFGVDVWLTFVSIILVIT